MDAATIQRARDSLERCNATNGFLERFYELFVATSPEIREKFADTDFERQRKALRDSLFLMLSAAGTTKGLAHRELEKLARRHSRHQLDIKPQWYALWLDCLLEAVSEHDPEFSPEIGEAWRDSLKPGIELLIAAY